MENFTDKEKENETIQFIERKKHLPMFDKLKNDFSIFVIKMNYENTNVLFKLLYDKHYRPFLYKYINNSDINAPNKTRTFISYNRDKFHYLPINKNEELIGKNDDEFFLENLYLYNSHKIYKNTLINKYSTFLFSISLFGSIIFQKKFISLFSAIGLGWNLFLYSKLKINKSDLLQYRDTNLNNYDEKPILKIYRTLYNEL
jgi:hypothetical protein